MGSDSRPSCHIPKYLPASYQTLLKACETYTLLWPGGEMALWEKGGVRDHIGRKLRGRSDPVILPGEHHLELTTHRIIPMICPRMTRGDRANVQKQKWRLERGERKTCLRLQMTYSSTRMRQSYMSRWTAYLTLS